MRAMFHVCSALALALVGAQASAAVCCAKCGAADGVQRVCRPVATTRFVETTAWDYACEEYCLPPWRGLRETLHPGDPSSTCVDCPRVHARHKLMKKTLVEEVPVIRWVVEYRCGACRDLPPALPAGPAPVGSDAGGTVPFDRDGHANAAGATTSR